MSQWWVKIVRVCGWTKRERGLGLEHTALFDNAGVCVKGNVGPRGDYGLDVVRGVGRSEWGVNDEVGEVKERLGRMRDIDWVSGGNVNVVGWVVDIQHNPTIMWWGMRIGESDSHYNAVGAPVRDPGSTRMNRGSTGMNRGSTGDDRDEIGMTRDNRGSTGKDRQRPARHREQPGRHWEQPGRHRSSTGAQLNRGVAVALPVSDAGIAPVSAGGVTVYRGSAGTLPAFTGAPPGHYRRQPLLCRASPG
ncbi:hypothetical protein DPMN_081688 [Dreissena polymorpha]|uniref:Uncharacterized protein n=1 Tax=Dreissena polymorpha TaxID=45954 RepID=A0A9D3Y5G5_DREPO|nr:hypothetical protein DPMN_081688 [Dreissena polymorpha]